jgi:hypothetical protein
MFGSAEWAYPMNMFASTSTVFAPVNYNSIALGNRLDRAMDGPTRPCRLRAKALHLLDGKGDLPKGARLKGAEHFDGFALGHILFQPCGDELSSTQVAER